MTPGSTGLNPVPFLTHVSAVRGAIPAHRATREHTLRLPVAAPRPGVGPGRGRPKGGLRDTRSILGWLGVSRQRVQNLAVATVLYRLGCLASGGAGTSPSCGWWSSPPSDSGPPRGLRRLRHHVLHAEWGGAAGLRPDAGALPRRPGRRHGRPSRLRRARRAEDHLGPGPGDRGPACRRWTSGRPITHSRGGLASSPERGGSGSNRFRRAVVKPRLHRRSHSHAGRWLGGLPGLRSP